VTAHGLEGHLLFPPLAQNTELEASGFLCLRNLRCPARGLQFENGVWKRLDYG
jgi:hypothetical protein